MSRIFEAIQSARESRGRTGVGVSDGLGEMDLPERRLDPRTALGMQLTVYGRTDTDAPFYEEAKAITGNANGGLFLLSVPVNEGQDLLLINNSNSKEQLCTVVSVRVIAIQTSEVSVSFPAPNPAFWEAPKRTAELI
jgi:hypothetical protein